MKIATLLMKIAGTAGSNTDVILKELECFDLSGSSTEDWLKVLPLFHPLWIFLGMTWLLKWHLSKELKEKHTRCSHLWQGITVGASDVQTEQTEVGDTWRNKDFEKSLSISENLQGHMHS